MESSDQQIDEIENKENIEEALPEECPLEVEIPEATLEVEQPPSPAPTPKKRGRPPGAKNKAKATARAPQPLSIVSSAPSTVATPPPTAVATPTVEDVASIMLDMLQERQAARRNAKRQLYRSFLDL